MTILLLDDSLRVQVFYEASDEDFEDNICLCIEEDCPDEERVMKHEQTNIYLTPNQARSLAEALLEAVNQSHKAAQVSGNIERVFDGDVESLRKPGRKRLLEVERVAQLSLEGMEASSLIDIGTGSGLFAEAFMKMGLEVHAIDINPEMVEAARRYLPGADVRLASAEEIPAQDDRYDVVFLGLVLNEVENPRAVLSESQRIAKKRVVILEWPYRQEEHGPPMEHRLRADEISSMVAREKFQQVETMMLENTVLYRLTVPESTNEM